LQIHVLNPDILGKGIYSVFKQRCCREDNLQWQEPSQELTSITFGQLNGQHLQFRNDKRPAKRCLMAHASIALAHARLYGWPVDPAVSAAGDQYGWQSPTYVSVRARTAMWALVDSPACALVQPVGADTSAASADIDTADDDSADDDSEAAAAVAAAAKALGLA